MKIRFHLGVAVVIFYVVFALSTVGFVVFAMSQDVDLVSSDYYARSLQHDRHMQAVANGGALGAALRIEVDHVSELVTVSIAQEEFGIGGLRRRREAEYDHRHRGAHDHRSLGELFEHCQTPSLQGSH